jgi:hypothetical protein
MTLSAEPFYGERFRIVRVMRFHGDDASTLRASLRTYKSALPHGTRYEVVRLLFLSVHARSIDRAFGHVKFQRGRQVLVLLGPAGVVAYWGLSY